MQAPSLQSNQQPPIQVNKHLVTFCTVAVFLYALTRLWIGAKISAYFEAAFLLPFYYVVFKNWWCFKKQYLTWLVIAMLAIPILQFCVHYYQDPVLAMEYQGVDKLFRLTFFLAPAFWLAHNLKLVPWFILANLAALIILILIQPDIYRFLIRTFKGWRTNFNDINSQFMALYSGIGIIAVATMLFQFKKLQRIRIRFLLYIFSAITIAFLIIPFIASQTRTAFLALLFSIVIAICLFIQHQHFTLTKLLKNKKLVITLLIVVISIFAIASQTNITTRVLIELSRLEVHQKKDHTILPDSFGGGRGEIWKYAMTKTIENPLTGFGGESRKDLISQSSELSNWTKNHLLHAHNSWLDFGIAYGLLGIILLTLFIWAFIKIALIQWNQTLKPNPYAAFTLTSTSFFIIMNLFESYLFFWQGAYLITWVATPCVAYAIYNKGLKSMGSDSST